MAPNPYFPLAFRAFLLGCGAYMLSEKPDAGDADDHAKPAA